MIIPPTDAPLRDMLYVKLRDVPDVQCYPVEEIFIGEGKISPNFTITLPNKKNVKGTKAQFISNLEDILADLCILAPSKKNKEDWKWVDSFGLGDVEDVIIQPGEQYPTEELKEFLQKYDHE